MIRFQNILTREGKLGPFDDIAIIEHFSVCEKVGKLSVLQRGVLRYYLLNNLVFVQYAREPLDNDCFDVLEIKYQFSKLRNSALELLGFTLSSEFELPPFHDLEMIGWGSFRLIFQNYTETSESWEEKVI